MFLLNFFMTGKRERRTKKVRARGRERIQKRNHQEAKRKGKKEAAVQTALPAALNSQMMSSSIPCLSRGLFHAPRTEQGFGVVKVNIVWLSFHLDIKLSSCVRVGFELNSSLVELPPGQETKELGQIGQ